MTSLRLPSRGHASSAFTSPASSSTSSTATSSRSIPAPQSFSNSNSKNTGSCVTSPPTSTSTSSSHIAVISTRATKLKRPSGSTPTLPTQKSLLGAGASFVHSRLQTPSKLMSRLHNNNKNASEKADTGDNTSSQISRPSSRTPSSSSSSRLSSTAQPHQQQQSRSISSSSVSGLGSMIARPTTATTTTTTAAASITTAASTAARVQKSTAVKPPSIVTKPSTTTLPSLSSSSPFSPSSSYSSSEVQSSSTSLSSLSSYPSTARSPKSSSAVRMPQTVSPKRCSAPPLSEQPSPKPSTRAKNRMGSGIDSACYMTRSGSSESFDSSSMSSVSSTPTVSTVTTMGDLSDVSDISEKSRSRHSTSLVRSRRVVSRRLSIPDLKGIVTNVASPSKHGVVEIRSPLSPTLKDTTYQYENMTALIAPSSNTLTSSESADADGSSQCWCQGLPPLEFPENIKREMKREEEEHRQRECGLYSMIIELQIENANLKGEKETLNRLVTRRDKSLLELHMQLKAMEFVVRENKIKVDVDMCTDEVLENWSFKESDETYQRVLVTTQELLSMGSKCLEENTVMSRSSSSHQPHQTRSLRGATSIPVGKLSLDAYRGPIPGMASGLGSTDSVQPLLLLDQKVDPSILRRREMSRPGMPKFDTQESNKGPNSINDKSTVNHSNLAEIDASLAEKNSKQVLDGGDDRSALFEDNDDHDAYEGDGDDDNTFLDDDDEEGQESEFEELGEDMIKFVDLEPSIAATPQRRSNPYGGGSVIGTPDMSSSARSKGLWSNGGRFSATTTPLHHPAYQFQQQQLQRQMSGGGASKRYSGGSTISSGSIVDDYFARSFSMEQNGNVAAPAAPIGLGLTGIDRPVEQSSMERFLSTSPMNTPPAPTLGPSSTTSSSFPYNSGPAASPLPFISSPSYHQQQFYMRSPLSTPSSATFFPAGVMMEPNQGFHSHHHPQRYLHHRSSLQSLRSSSNGSVSSGRLSRAATVTPTPTPATPPPPMGPLPPLPKNPTCTYREHTKQKLLDFNRRPTHARTNSHGFVIENVGQFLKKKSYSKALTRDYMSRGHRRRGSM